MSKDEKDIRIRPLPIYSQVFFFVLLHKTYSLLLHFPILSFAVNSQQRHILREREKPNHILSMFDLLLYEAQKRERKQNFSLFILYVQSFSFLSVRFLATSRVVIDCTYRLDKISALRQLIVTYTATPTCSAKTSFDILSLSL